MPIYEYLCSDQPNCHTAFEAFVRVSEADNAICPTCGKPAQRIMSAPSMATSQSHLLKEKHFSERGFTQYRKVGGGVYEKTAGDGPKFISGDAQ